jgi:anti-sigma regulatory factor (Ser/Thr protein kinase)
MIIILPQFLNINSFACLFNGIVDDHRRPTCSRLTIDFSNLKFIEPTGITALSNLIHWLYAHGIKVTLSGYEIYSQAIAYLDDSKFFEHHLGFKINPAAQTRTTTKPLEFIQTSHSLMWLQQNLLQWITNNSGKSHATFLELLVALQEIFQNIRDHSGTYIGSVYAQYFPANGKLFISISDIGVGIPVQINEFLRLKSLREHTIFDKLSSSSAIIKACEEGFTTSSHPGNAGRGLADLVLIINKYYKGNVRIISDNGYVQYSGENQYLYIADREWLYPGCLIDIELNINSISNVEDSSEDFEW